jgi:hypothetical protein
MANPAPYTDTSGETDAQVNRASSSVYPGTLRWVKVSGIVALILIVLVLVVMVLGGGEHGPMRHIPSGSGRTNTPPIALGSEPTCSCRWPSASLC